METYEIIILIILWILCISIGLTTGLLDFFTAGLTGIAYLLVGWIMPLILYGIALLIWR